MKKVLLTVTGFIAVAMLFSGVGYAAATWSIFEGKDDIQQSENDIDKIMEILEKVNNGKITAEEGVSLLTSEVNSLEGQVKHLKSLLDGVTGENPGQKIQFLKDEVERLFNENAVLATDLAASNKTIETQKTTITAHLETIDKLNADLTSANQAKTDAENAKTDAENAKTDAENAKTDAENALAGKQEELNNKQKEIEQKNQEIQQKNQEIQDKIDEGNRKVAEKQDELDNSNSYVGHLEEELRKANEAAQSVSNKTSEALTKAQGYVTEDVDQE